MPFPDKNFMLKNSIARKLYFEYAEKLPIIDYHCHLDPKQIYENKNFRNITELMLGGDHYKWRAMRSCGIEEKFITGNADDREKFRMWAKTVAYAIGNPLYHWTHLELNRYFKIDTPLNEQTADEIYDRCNEMLKSDDFKPQSLIKRSNVKVVCTTDSPLDDLYYHRKLAEEFKECKVLPAFRPDILIEIKSPAFLQCIRGNCITSFDKLLNTISEKINFFDSAGCRLSDHGLGTVPYAVGNAEKVFEKAANGNEISALEENIYKTAVLNHCAKEYYKHGWTMQLHIGAVRNNNTPMFKKLGPDSGFDSINDCLVAQPLADLMNLFETNGHLPKTILYNLNPKDNYVLASMIGNFQSAPYFGKIQFGSGWWFNDQRDGIESQLKTLSNLGILSTFVGMLTDSRSFISYPRHEYFRRILCNLIGTWVYDSEYPEDYTILEKIIKNICYNNAKNYFGF